LIEHYYFLGGIIIVADLIARLMNVIILDPTSSLSFPKKHQTHNKDDPINKNEINSLHNFGAILEDHEHSTDDSQDITHQCDPPKIVNTAQSMFMLKPSSEY
jgi:hypothetical protein